MFRVKTFHFALALVFCSSLTAFGQWSAATSGTTNNLNGIHLLDAGVGYVVGARDHDPVVLRGLRVSMELVARQGACAESEL